MARGAALQVLGAAQLRRTLKDAGVGVQDLKDAHRAVAELVATRSAPRAPRRTGALAASVRPAGIQGEAIVRVGRASVPYAGPIHWGWPARGITAQPWLYETARETQNTWESMYLDALDAIIRTVEGTTTP